MISSNLISVYNTRAYHPHRTIFSGDRVAMNCMIITIEGEGMIELKTKDQVILRKNSVFFGNISDMCALSCNCNYWHFLCYWFVSLGIDLPQNKAFQLPDADLDTENGLTDCGIAFVEEMERIGMLIDLAHSSDATMRDVLGLSEHPVAYTHGCCRALASHRRNISDELMRAIGERGGIVCMSIYPCFLDDAFVRTLEASGLQEEGEAVEAEFIKDPGNPEKAAAWAEIQRMLAALPRPSVGRVADHIEHAVNVAGVDHVGLGTDYDGIEVTAEGLEDISKFPALFDELRRRGFSRKEISKIAGENFLQVLKVVRKRV